MNKIQMIKLLEIRGVQNLNGRSIVQAIEESGGMHTTEELAVVNGLAMEHFAKALAAEKEKTLALQEKIDSLIKLEWHDWPGEEPIPDEQPFSVSVLLETSVGYAVGYYNSKRREWMLDDASTNQQTIIDVTAEITRWAYLPKPGKI